MKKSIFWFWFSYFPISFPEFVQKSLTSDGKKFKPYSVTVINPSSESSVYDIIYVYGLLRVFPYVARIGLLQPSRKIVTNRSTNQLLNSRAAISLTSTNWPNRNCQFVTGLPLAWNKPYDIGHFIIDRHYLFVWSLHQISFSAQYTIYFVHIRYFYSRSQLQHRKTKYLN